MEVCKLYESKIFGPVQSRRLGSSLGINLLPVDAKICNFNCIYCECGWTDLKKINKATFPTPAAIHKELQATLKELRLIDQLPDNITFAGNGEPTLHPRFAEIMDDVSWLRNKFSPGSRITVFTNGTMLNRKEIVDALKKADHRIIKLDAGTQTEFLQIDQPIVHRTIDWLKEHIKYFDSKVTIQSLFLRGYYGGKLIDNTSAPSVKAWLELINEIKPESVMLYSIDRPTAAPSIQKIDKDVLLEIAEKVEELGIRTQVN
jgi:wyosine [tRNA(Phe)-imidazoG37] synthetase (radical SAM superfamily)